MGRQSTTGIFRELTTRGKLYKKDETVGEMTHSTDVTTGHTQCGRKVGATSLHRKRKSNK